MKLAITNELLYIVQWYKQLTIYECKYFWIS